MHLFNKLRQPLFLPGFARGIALITRRLARGLVSNDTGSSFRRSCLAGRLFGRFSGLQLEPFGFKGGFPRSFLGRLAGKFFLLRRGAFGGPLLTRLVDCLTFGDSCHDSRVIGTGPSLKFGQPRRHGVLGTAATFQMALFFEAAQYRPSLFWRIKAAII